MVRSRTLVRGCGERSPRSEKKSGEARRWTPLGRPGGASWPGGLASDEFARDALVLVPRVLEHFTPGDDIGPPPQQRAPLTFGHAAPYAELDPVVECVGQALGADGAAPADQLGPVLRRALDEELVRVRSLARGARGPIRDPHVAQLLLIVTPAGGSSRRVALSLRLSGV